MHVASFSPLSIGGVHWRSPEPTYTVVLKATFSLAQDGPLQLDLQQTPVGDDVAGSYDGELFYGSDFAPRKVGVDIMVVGHARAAEPAPVLPFAIQLGETRHVLQAVGDQPSHEVPLWSRHVMSVTRDARQTVQLAPRPTETRRWLREVPSGFDYSVFNAASPELRLEELPADGLLRLEGLLSRAPVRSVILYDLHPYVFYVPDAQQRTGAELLYPVCDTLWIDTDRERLVMCWRCELRPAHPNPFLAVVLASRRHAPRWSDVVGQLSRARWHDAFEPPPPRWPTGSMPVPEAIRSETGMAEPWSAPGSGFDPGAASWEEGAPATPSWSPTQATGPSPEGDDEPSPPTPRRPPTPVPRGVEASRARESRPHGASSAAKKRVAETIELGPDRLRAMAELDERLRRAQNGDGADSDREPAPDTTRARAKPPRTGLPRRNRRTEPLMDGVLAPETDPIPSRETVAPETPAMDSIADEASLADDDLLPADELIADEDDLPVPDVDEGGETEAIDVEPDSERTEPSLVIEPAGSEER